MVRNGWSKLYGFPHFAGRGTRSENVHAFAVVKFRSCEKEFRTTKLQEALGLLVRFWSMLTNPDALMVNVALPKSSVTLNSGEYETCANSLVHVTSIVTGACGTERKG